LKRTSKDIPKPKCQMSKLKCQMKSKCQILEIS
jgi:hypothetical protein